MVTIVAVEFVRYNQCNKGFNRQVDNSPTH